MNQIINQIGNKISVESLIVMTIGIVVLAIFNVSLVHSLTIDQAIDRYGIHEDTTAFIYEPHVKNISTDVLFLYELTDLNHFEVTYIYSDVSGIDQEVTQMENSD